MAKITSIKFDDGLKSYAINGDENRVIRFNPTDFNISKRAQEAAEKIEKIVKKYEDNGAEDLTSIEELDTETRNAINYICGADVCTAAFGDTHAMAICGGTPIYENFLNSLMQIIKSEAQKEQVKISKKAKNYIDNVKSSE